MPSEKNGNGLTYTDNVSAHSACIVSNHPWQPGELAEITSMLDQIAMRGKAAESGAMMSTPSD